MLDVDNSCLCAYDSLRLSICSLVNVSFVIDVVHEGHNHLVPTREIAVGLHRNQVSEPSDVLDLLLLDLEVGVEATVVELLFESHRELPDRLFEHDLV